MTLWIAGSLCRKEALHAYIHKYTHTLSVLPKEGLQPKQVVLTENFTQSCLIKVQIVDRPFEEFLSVFNFQKLTPSGFSVSKSVRTMAANTTFFFALMEINVFDCIFRIQESK